MTPLAITLYQPWAALVGRGKEHETRSWAISYRGPLIIHAGADWTEGNRELQINRDFRTAAWSCLRDEYSAWAEVPKGAIVAVCRVVDCLPTEAVRDTISRDDRLFGNYTDGRYAWKLADVRLLAEPVRCKGWQRLWRPPLHVIAAIDEQIGCDWRGKSCGIARGGNGDKSSL